MCKIKIMSIWVNKGFLYLRKIVAFTPLTYSSIIYGYDDRTDLYREVAAVLCRP